MRDSKISFIHPAIEHSVDKNSSPGTIGASFRLNEFLLYDANSSPTMYLVRMTSIHNMKTAPFFGICCQIRPTAYSIVEEHPATRVRVTNYCFKYSFTVTYRLHKLCQWFEKVEIKVDAYLHKLEQFMNIDNSIQYKPLAVDDVFVTCFFTRFTFNLSN